MLASSGCDASDKKSFLHPIFRRESGVALPEGISQAFSVGSTSVLPGGASELQAARASATANVEEAARQARFDALRGAFPVATRNKNEEKDDIA
jgi:hypothetical protein